MRNLKKVLALCVALTMAFGLMISASAFTDDASITNTDAVNMLTQLKIISGFPDGSFKPAGTVTRAEMAKMVYVALRRGTDDKGTAFINANVPLSDINSHWAKGYIKFAYGADIISGYPNGTFRPDGQVTGTEAAKMLLTALGYKSEIEGYVGIGWDYEIAVDAASAGLLDEIEDVDLSKPLTRDNAAQMIYNAIFAKMVVYDDGMQIEGQTFAEAKMGLVKIEGLLTANDQAGVGTDVADDGNYKIWGDFDDDNVDEMLEIEGTADISLLGQDVTAFVKVKDGVATDDIRNSDDVVKTYGKVFATPGENTVVIDYGDSVNDDNDTDEGTVLFKNYGTLTNVVYTTDEEAFEDYNGNGDQDTGLDETKGTVATADDVDYNGDGDKTDTDLDEPDYAPVKGDKSIYIDNDDDGVYNIVIELEMHYDSGINIEEDDATIDGADIFDDEDIADVIGADVIKDGDAVVAYAIEDCNSDYVGGVTKCETVEGTLKSTRGGDEVKIDTTYYELSAINGVDNDLWANLTNDGNYGQTVTVILDLGGFIVDYDSDAEDTPDNYCGIREIQLSEAGDLGGQDAKVAVTLQDGTDAVYVVKGIGDDIGANFDPTDDDLYDGAPYANEAAALAAMEDYYVGSVFAYSLNSDNEITLKSKVASIDNVTDLSDDSVTSTLKAGGYDNGDSTLKLDAGTYTVRSTSVFFSYEDEDFDVYVGKAEAPSIDELADASVYDNGDYSTKTASVVLVGSADATSEDTGNYALVLNVDVDYSDGDYYLTITAFDGESIITITGDDGVGCADPDEPGIEEGDVIEYVMDGSVMSDYDLRTVNSDYTVDDDFPNEDNDQVFYGGFAVDYSVEDGYITMRNGAAADDDNDATFALASDCTIGEIDDLDATEVKATGNDVDPTTDENDIEDDFDADEGNVIIEYDVSDGEVTAIYFINDDTVDLDTNVL